MPNYYELLGVTLLVNAAEIEAACDAQYAKWARLVTHHDPATADEANQMIRLVETIRTTLTDPTRRSIYDAGLNGTSGGLVDPTYQAVQPNGGGMPSPPPPIPPQATGAATSLWTCPNPTCGVENQPNTRFCPKCGTQLVQECPECHQTTSFISTGRCSTCGYDHTMASRRKELRAAIAQTQQELNNLKAQQNKADENYNSYGCGGFFYLALILGASCLGVSLVLDVQGQDHPFFVPGAILTALGFIVGIVLFVWMVKKLNKEKVKSKSAVAHMPPLQQRIMQLSHELHLTDRTTK